jgi:histidinol-phosphate aminotransferase
MRGRSRLASWTTDNGLMRDPELRERITARPDLADLEGYRAPQIEAQVRLNTNESPYPPPEAFFSDLGERISSLELNRYPDREVRELRERLAAHVGTLTERVWVANGSNEVLLQSLLAFGGPERKAMTFEPTYAMHWRIARTAGTRVLRARRNVDFTLHLEASLEAVAMQQPDILFMCSPNNPTGNANTQEEIEAICRAAPGVVILDEAYTEFSGTTFLRLLEDFDNLIVTRSFSKAWRLAGARLGYMVAQPWVIEQLERVRLPYHLSTLSQTAGLVALDHVAELLSTVETIRHERDRFWRELSTMKGITAFPSQANFILFRCDAAPAREVWERLLDKGVLVRDFSEVPGCEECLRVSVGTPQQDERFLEALWEALRSE